ncbi:Uncharacterized protein FKW44_020220, partial [Caligus rogercresseyi]
MEQTRRDTVIELLCAGHRPTAIIKLLKYPRRTVYDITKKWEESGMSKRYEHRPGMTGSSQEVHQGDTHAHPRKKAWGPPVVVPWMDSVASGTPYIFQQDSAPIHKAKFVQSWLRKNVPNFSDVNSWPPNSPDLSPSDYY